MEIDLTLNGVNEEQEIATPDDAKPLNDLFMKLGINPIELLQGAQSGAGLGGLLEGLGGGSSDGELPGSAAAPAKAKPRGRRRLGRRWRPERIPRMRTGRVDPGRPAELREEAPVGRPWRAAERQG